VFASISCGDVQRGLKATQRARDFATTSAADLATVSTLAVAVACTSSPFDHRLVASLIDTAAEVVGAASVP
jgi:hypothetical protein